MAAVGSQTVLPAATLGTGVAAAEQALLLAAYAPTGTLAIRSTMLVAGASFEGRGVAASSQLAMLIAYRTGATANLTNRVWSFVLDGHTFYVITLGEQGTFVYDFLTGQWAKWETAGLNTWNMEIGTTWKGDIIAADRQNPVIWRLDPTSFLDDDYKTQTRKVTGGLPVRGRDFIGNYAFRLTASLGTPTVPLTAPATIPEVELLTSDDQGKTFFSHGKLTLIVDDFTQELAWRSLGDMKAPQRVFKIVDTGAIVRVSGADAEVDGED